MARGSGAGACVAHPPSPRVPDSFDVIALISKEEGNGGATTTTAAPHQLKALRVVRVLRVLKLARLLRMSRVFKVPPPDASSSLAIDRCVTTAPPHLCPARLSRASCDASPSPSIAHRTRPHVVTMLSSRISSRSPPALPMFVDRPGHAPSFTLSFTPLFTALGVSIIHHVTVM